MDKDYRNIHKIIFENYYQSASNLTKNEKNEIIEPKIIKFTSYNGPTVAHHTTKRLMVPMLTIPYDKKSFYSNDLDHISRDKFKEHFTDNILRELNEKLNNVNKFDESIFENLTYSLCAKLGKAYFSGKAFNWGLNFSFKDITDVLAGGKIEGLQKGARLSTAFNGNKGISDEFKYENFLRKKNFKYTDQTSEYDLKLLNKQKDLLVNINLDENLKFVDATYLKDKLFNIDVLRDGRKSFDKLTGSYSDLFDLRFQLFSYNKKIKNEDVLDLLCIKDAGENILNELLKQNADGSGLVLNEKIGIKFQYLRHIKTKRYHVPMKHITDTNASEFLRYLTIRVATVTEYNRFSNSFYNEEQAENKEEVESSEFLLEKQLIANSTIICSFDFDKWLKDLKPESEKLSTDYLMSMLSGLSYYLFDTTISLSNEAFVINNESLGINIYLDNQNKIGIFKNLFEKRNQKVHITSTVKYALNNKLVDYDNLAFLKKIVYSKNYLEIFDLNVATLSEFSEEMLERSYKTIAKKLKFSTDNKNSDNTEDDLVSIRNVSGVVRIAIKKLNDAYNVLKEESRRETYLSNLLSLKKHRHR